MKLGKQHAIGKRLNHIFTMPSTQVSSDLDLLLNRNLRQRLYHQLADVLDDEIVRGLYAHPRKVN